MDETLKHSWWPANTIETPPFAGRIYFGKAGAEVLLQS
jgi:hypothetical protein